MKDQIRNIVDTIGVPATTAVIGSAVYTGVYGWVNVPVMGVRLPAPVLFAGVMFGSSLAGDVVADKLVPLVSGNEYAGTLAKLAKPVGVGVSASALVTGISLVSRGTISTDGMIEAFIIGGGSELISNYVVETVMN